MNWRFFLIEPETGRLRCWWRALIFLGVALAATLAIVGLFAMPLFITTAPTGKPTAATLQAVQTLFFIALPIAFLLAGFWALRTFDGLPPVTLGIAIRGPWLRIMLIMAILGALLASLLIALLCLGGFGTCELRIANLSNPQPLLIAAAIVCLIAFYEEVVLHGYLFQTLLRGSNPAVALFVIGGISTVVFALLTPEHSPLSLVNVLVLSILSGMVYLRFGMLWAPIGLNAGWSLAAVMVDFHGNPIAEIVHPPIQMMMTGPSLITGGSLGPDAGVLASVLLLGALAAVTYARIGLPLETRWWEWGQLNAMPKLPPAWDFSIGSRHYQWKLLVRDTAE